MNPLVSIIIPVFNTQKEYFEPCIKSVLGQTSSEFEVLVIDDGSGQECADLLEKWAHLDTRIRLYHLKNAGVSHARNYAIEKAQGKYILFVDSDDMINRYWLEWAVKKAQEENADAVFGGIQGVPRSQAIDTGKMLSGKYFVVAQNEMWKIQCGQLINGLKDNDSQFEVDKHGVWGRLVRKDIIGSVRFEEGMYYGEDQVFNHSLICRMKKVIYNADQIYYLLEDRPGSATNTYDPKRLDIINAYLKCLKNCLIQDTRVQNAYYLHILSLIDNHIDHARKTQNRTNIPVPELRRYLKEAIKCPLFQEAIENSDLSVHVINKSYMKLWLTKHRAITAIAIFYYSKQMVK